MKTPFAPLALAAAAAFAAPALAQSSVTLSGIADAGVRWVDNDGVASAKSMVSGSNATSRIILRGTEDLGAGLSAGFHLEHGLILTTGAQASSTLGQFWDRRSTVSLMSKSLGEVRAGRDFVPSYANWSVFDPFSYVGAAGANNLISATPQGPIRAAFGTNPNTTVRANDALQLLLPGGLGGAEGGVLLAPSGGGTVANGKNKVIGVRLGWAGGAWRMSAARTQTENNLTTAGKFTDTALGGAYDFGIVRITAAWRRFDYASAQQTNLLLGATVPVGGAGQVKLSWGKADFDGTVGATDISANGASLFGLGYVHSLSKRTALYGTLSRINNDGGLTLAVPGGSSGMTAGGASKGAEVGVRHTF
jgi:predicted porin